MAVWVLCDEMQQQALIQTDPLRYFRPPYVGVRGWIGIYLDVTVDWDEAERLVEYGYALAKAPSKRKRSGERPALS